ncbi:aldolase-type TIM barrel family protein [Striga asiatica]|uniref:Aldolase-type TIM barrel family protein n=1 Tax=Striga asiatica TaxID=4170 RepID=A0A5A7QB41_STRAF|nr:aldolase-type TIM barrel family protein [Striga asiatica]
MGFCLHFFLHNSFLSCSNLIIRLRISINLESIYFLAMVFWPFVVPLISLRPVGRPVVVCAGGGLELTGSARSSCDINWIQLIFLSEMIFEKRTRFQHVLGAWKELILEVEVHSGRKSSLQRRNLISPPCKSFKGMVMKVVRIKLV